MSIHNTYIIIYVYLTYIFTCINYFSMYISFIYIYFLITVLSFVKLYIKKNLLPVTSTNLLLVFVIIIKVLRLQPLLEGHLLLGFNCDAEGQKYFSQILL